MPSRVGIDPESVLIAWQTGCTKLQYLTLGEVDILHLDIEMELLRALRIGPRGRDEIGGKLEGDPRPTLATNCHPVAGSARDGKSEQFGIEPGQCVRVGTVDDNGMQTSDHLHTMPDTTDNVQVIGLSTESPSCKLLCGVRIDTKRMRVS